MNDKPIWYIEDIAKFLGKSEEAVRAGYKRWGIPVVRIGRRIATTEEKMRKWLSEREGISQ